MGVGICEAHGKLQWRDAFGMFRDKVNLYPGWDSEDEDLRIEAMFEALQEQPDCEGAAEQSSGGIG